METSADIRRLGSCNMLALGLVNSFILHLQVLTALSGQCFSETADDLVRVCQLYNIKRLSVKLRGAIPSNHMQQIFLFPTSEQI